MKFLEYALEWVENVKSMGFVEPSTADDYRKSLVAWQSLAEIELRDVSRRQIEAGMRSMLSQGRVPSTVRKRLVTLRHLFDDAVAYGDVESNPCDGIRNPKQRKTPKNYLPVEERERLKARIASSNLQITVAAAIALYAGLREAEICALRASDVNLEAKVGWVRRAIGRDGGKTYLKDAKNGQMRDFPIPEPLSMALGRWIDSNCVHGNSFLLTGSDRWADPIVLGRKWASLCELEGFQGVLGKAPTFHDLRHTYATVAIASGVDVKTVSSVLGHASAAMTLDIYAVADPVAKRMSAEVMACSI